MWAGISTAFLVATQISFTNVAALQATRLDSLQTRSGQQSTTEYNEDTAGLSKEGACRMYTGLEWKTSQGITLTCTKMCGNLVYESSVNGTTKSTSCIELQPATDPVEDPSGDEFTMGACICDIPFLDTIVTDVVLALPAIAEIGCEMIFDALDQVIDLGTDAIPGIGEMTAGMKAAAKAVKTIDKWGEKVADITTWLNPCGSNNYTEEVDSFWDPLSNIPDSEIEPGGCKASKKKCTAKTTKREVVQGQNKELTFGDISKDLFRMLRGKLAKD